MTSAFYDCALLGANARHRQERTEQCPLLTTEVLAVSIQVVCDDAMAALINHF